MRFSWFAWRFHVLASIRAIASQRLVVISSWIISLLTFVRAEWWLTNRMHALMFWNLFIIFIPGFSWALLIYEYCPRHFSSTIGYLLWFGLVYIGGFPTGINLLGSIRFGELFCSLSLWFVNTFLLSLFSLWVLLKHGILLALF